MAALWHREEYQHYVERRTKISRPQPPPQKKLPYDGEIHHLSRLKNFFDHNLFVEPSVNSASVVEVREIHTIDSNEAAAKYGGISIIDYRIKKPAVVSDFKFRVS